MHVIEPWQQQDAGCEERDAHDQYCFSVGHERPADVRDDEHRDKSGKHHGEGRENIRRPSEQSVQDLYDQHGRDHRQRCRKRSFQNVRHEAVRGDLFRLFQRQQEAGQTDAAHIDETHLQCRERIGETEQDKDHAQHCRVQRLCEVERGDSLYVRNDHTAFPDDVLHGSEIRIQENDVCGLFRGLRTGCHRNTAVSVFDRQYIVHTVSDHRDGLAVRLPCLDEGLLLLGLDTAKDVIFRDFLGKQDRVCRKRRRVDVLIASFDAGLYGDRRDCHRVIAGQDLDLYAFFRKVLEGLSRVFLNNIGDDDSGDGRYHADTVILSGDPARPAEKKDTISFL